MAERDAERGEFQRQTETMGLGRKVKRGDCWWPINVGRSYYNSLNFEYGRQVMFFHVDASDSISYFKFAATVSYAQEDRMVIVVPDGNAVAELQGRERVGVQLSFDEHTYQLMLQAA